jgi:hypothetical protein
MSADPDILLDLDDWCEHEQQRIERARLHPALPYCRLLIAATLRHAEVVCWPGNFVCENQHRYDRVRTLVVKQEAWEWLDDAQTRWIWNAARFMGMVLPLYDDFLAEIHHRIDLGHRWPRECGEGRRAAVMTRYQSHAA